MYLNLIQVAESFGVSEKVVEDWIRNEDLPHVLDRGRLVFDRAQVATWAVSRGLAARTGFLAPEPAAFSKGTGLDALLRTGGIWRDVAPEAVGATLDRIVDRAPGAVGAVRELLRQRMQANAGINWAPVGGGFALPHLAARVTLGRESGLIALVLLNAPLAADVPAPDDEPVRRLFFFLAPSPRAHLDILGGLSRLLARGPLRGLIAAGATDAEILAAMTASASGGPAKPNTGGRA